MNIDGDTPLHGAAVKGHLDIVKFIMERVNNKNPANHGGDTPLDEALYFGHLDVGKLIENMAELTPEEKSHLAHHLNHEKHDCYALHNLH